MIRIVNGKLVDPASSREGEFDLLIEKGRIVAMEKRGGIPEKKGMQTIDATSKVIVPGFVDLHVHLREPGEEYKETIRTGCEAAAAGGFTTICCMANTDPVNDHGALTEYILRKAAEANGVHVRPIGAVSKGLRGEELAEIGEMKEAGIVAISDDGRPVMNSDLMRHAMEYARNFDLPLVSHAEDLNLSQGAVMNEGYGSTRLGLKGAPSCAEEIMVARDILLSEWTGAHVHMAHVSTRGSVELIRRAKERGLNVSAEVTPHHLILTEELLNEYNTNAKVNPPLRSDSDREALWRGLKEGVIDCIATDHAPHDIHAKEVDIDQAAFGIIGLESAFPLCLKLVEEGVLTFRELISRMTIQPARLFHLEVGSLDVGSPADLTIVDLEKEFRYDVQKGRSKGRNSPIDQWSLKGEITKTMVGGRIVFSKERDTREE